MFDLGGGTFDVSVLEVGGGIIEVVWTGGDAFLVPPYLNFWDLNTLIGRQRLAPHLCSSTEE